jgi:hypothetical protein
MRQMVAIPAHQGRGAGVFKQLVPHFAKCGNENPRLEFRRLYEALWQDEKRNAVICADAVGAVREGRSPLVLTERTGHLELLAERLSREAINVVWDAGIALRFGAFVAG